MRCFYFYERLGFHENRNNMKQKSVLEMKNDTQIKIQWKG